MLFAELKRVVYPGLESPLQQVCSMCYHRLLYLELDTLVYPYTIVLTFDSPACQYRSSKTNRKH